jgi:hypothetical protein
LGRRTGGGFNLVDVDILYGSTTAVSVIRSAKLRCSLKNLLPRAK